MFVKRNMNLQQTQELYFYMMVLKVLILLMLIQNLSGIQIMKNLNFTWKTKRKKNEKMGRFWEKDG